MWALLIRIAEGVVVGGTSSLLLLSEYVDEPRFGDRVGELALDGALALGFVVIRQVAALHEHGIAHNNISPSALLFKGAAATRTVMPAMIGLVEPAMDAEAMAGDCRQLAGGDPYRGSFQVRSEPRPLRSANLSGLNRTPMKRGSQRN